MKKTAITKLMIMSISVFTLSGCGNSSTVTSVSFDPNYQKTWHVGEIDFSSLHFIVTHDNGLVETVPVKASMVDKNDIYKFYQVGEWDVKLTYEDGFSGLVKFSIIENEFSEEIKLADASVVYDGQPHGLSLTGPVPEGTNIYFPEGNNFSEASKEPYQIKCVLAKEGYKSKELNGKLTICRADYDKEILDKIVFEDAEFTYDGTEKRVEAKSIPADLNVEYFIGKNKGNSQIFAGEYTVEARFTSTNPNYNEIPSKTAKLVIHKANYDLNGVTFNDQTFVYEKGASRSLAIQNIDKLPFGVTVSYENNNQTNIGTYEVKANFKGDERNYEKIDSMTAKLTIIPKEVDLSMIKIGSPQHYEYDGQTKEFELDVPDYVRVDKSYYTSDGSLSGDHRDANTYFVLFEFSFVDDDLNKNCVIINEPDDKGVMVIDKKTIDLSEYSLDQQTKEWNGEEQEFDIISKTDKTPIQTDILDIRKEYYLDGIKLEGKPIEVGSYTVLYSITLKNGISPENAELLGTNTGSARFVISKIIIDMTDPKYNAKNQEYTITDPDEEGLRYEVYDPLPEGVLCAHPFYKEEGPEDGKVGTWSVNLEYYLAEGYSPDHYEIIQPYVTQAILVVKPMLIDCYIFSFTNQVSNYTGNPIPYDSKNIVNYAENSRFVDPSFQYRPKNSSGDFSYTAPTEPGDYDVLVKFYLTKEFSKKGDVQLVNDGSDRYTSLTIIK